MITTTITAYVNCPHCGKHAVIHGEHLHNTWWHLTPTGLTYWCP